MLDGFGQMADGHLLHRLGGLPVQLCLAAPAKRAHHHLARVASELEAHEIVGYLVAAAPLLCFAPQPPLVVALSMLAAFGLFRLFDIWKPWPIRALDRSVHGGFGIMLDDLLAGAAAALPLWGALYAWTGRLS